MPSLYDDLSTQIFKPLYRRDLAHADVWPIFTTILSTHDIQWRGSHWSPEQLERLCDVLRLLWPHFAVLRFEHGYTPSLARVLTMDASSINPSHVLPRHVQILGFAAYEATSFDDLTVLCLHASPDLRFVGESLHCDNCPGIVHCGRLESDYFDTLLFHGACTACILTHQKCAWTRYRQALVHFHGIKQEDEGGKVTFIDLTKDDRDPAA